ncbi:outer membrane protein [Palleronia sp.]|uniref:outer membrane protein n=1 Tax=Palleronia sp. TaxID=1940284 RepID=UPI0035C87352
MKLVTLTAAGALFAGAAYAGGVAPAPVEPVPMAPAPIVMPTQDWTGGYAGLSLGYGRGDGSIDGEDLDFDADGDGDDDDDDDNIIDDIFGEADAEGVIGGAFAGYQHDFGRFVLGGELDLNAADISSEDDDDDAVDFDGLSIDSVHRLKLRAGYDAGNTLIYGVVGAAYAKAELADREYEGVGGVIGAGVDYKVTPNVVVGAEVLYHDFNDFDDTGLDADATSVQARVAYQF